MFHVFLFFLLLVCIVYFDDLVFLGHVQQSFLNLLSTSWGNLHQLFTFNQKYRVLNFFVKIVLVDLCLSHFRILLYFFHWDILTKYLIDFLHDILFIEGIPSILRPIDNLNCLIFLQDPLWGLRLLHRLLFANLFVWCSFLLWPPWSFSSQ